MAIGAGYRPRFAGPLLCPMAADTQFVHDLLAGQPPLRFQLQNRTRLPGKRFMARATSPDSHLVPPVRKGYPAAAAAVQDHFFRPFIFNGRNLGKRARNQKRKGQQNEDFHFIAL